MVGQAGFEPAANRLRGDCSTPELLTHAILIKNGVLAKTFCRGNRGLRVSPLPFLFKMVSFVLFDVDLCYGRSSFNQLRG